MKIKSEKKQTKFVLAKRHPKNEKGFAFVAKDGIRFALDERIFIKNVLAEDSPEVLQNIKNCDPILLNFNVYEVTMEQKMTTKVEKFRRKTL